MTAENEGEDLAWQLQDALRKLEDVHHQIDMLEMGPDPSDGSLHSPPRKQGDSTLTPAGRLALYREHPPARLNVPTVVDRELEREIEELLGVWEARENWVTMGDDLLQRTLRAIVVASFGTTREYLFSPELHSAVDACVERLSLFSKTLWGIR